MSDVMLLGILRMPMDYPLDAVTFTQVVSACRQAADRIEANEKVRQSIWNIVGECIMTDAEKLSQIEMLLLESEKE